MTQLLLSPIGDKNIWHMIILFYFFSNAEGIGYYLEDDPEYDDEIGEEYEKFLLEQELQWCKTEEWCAVFVNN